MNKITIEVDFGYAFDFLSIYAVKMEKHYNNVNVKNYTEAWHHIKSQIGDKIHEVMESEEYDNLILANTELFELVDLAKTDAVKASVVDAGVYKRFLAKRALQEKFFPDSDKIEQKIGYLK